MELTILGSGTSVPHPKRSSSAFWLRTTGGTILLDCSASAVHRMAQEDLDWAGLDAIWISHFHLDHCGGLAPYLFGMKHAPTTQNREKPLRVFGAKGLRELVEAFSDAGGYGLLKQPFPLEIVEIELLEEFEILPGIAAVALKTPHIDSSAAIHIRDGEKTIVFTADTGFDDILATFARRVDLLLMECSFVRDKPVEIHLDLSEAMFITRKAEPKKVVLTHLYPNWDDIDFDKEIRKFSPGCEVLEAIDGLKLAV